MYDVVREIVRLTHVPARMIDNEKVVKNVKRVVPTLSCETLAASVRAIELRESFEATISRAAICRRSNLKRLLVVVGDLAFDR